MTDATGGGERLVVGACPNCGLIRGNNLEYRFPNPSKCNSCGAEAEHTAFVDAEKARSLLPDTDQETSNDD